MIRWIQKFQPYYGIKCFMLWKNKWVLYVICITKIDLVSISIIYENNIILLQLHHSLQGTGVRPEHPKLVCLVRQSEIDKVVRIIIGSFSSENWKLGQEQIEHIDFIDTRPMSVLHYCYYNLHTLVHSLHLGVQHYNATTISRYRV